MDSPLLPDLELDVTPSLTGLVGPLDDLLLSSALMPLVRETALEVLPPALLSVASPAVDDALTAAAANSCGADSPKNLFSNLESLRPAIANPPVLTRLLSL